MASPQRGEAILLPESPQPVSASQELRTSNYPGYIPGSPAIGAYALGADPVVGTAAHSPSTTGPVAESHTASAFSLIPQAAAHHLAGYAPPLPQPAESPTPAPPRSALRNAAGTQPSHVSFLEVPSERVTPVGGRDARFYGMMFDKRSGGGAAPTSPSRRAAPLYGSGIGVGGLHGLAGSPSIRTNRTFSIAQPGMGQGAVAQAPPSHLVPLTSQEQVNEVQLELTLQHSLRIEKVGPHFCPIRC